MDEDWIPQASAHLREVEVGPLWGGERHEGEKDDVESETVCVESKKPIMLDECCGGVDWQMWVERGTNVGSKQRSKKWSEVARSGM